MSLFGWKADGILEGAEGRLMTRLGSSYGVGRRVLFRHHDAVAIIEWISNNPLRICSLFIQLLA